MKKFFTIFFCSMAIINPTAAQDEAKADYISAKLITAHEAYGNLAGVEMGLDVTLVPDWYTYWRMPGDSGLPSTFDWKNSTNVRTVEFFWPAPRRFNTFDMNSFGYMGEVLLPMTVTPEMPGKDMVVDLEIKAVVCNEICVPQTLHVSKTITAQPKKSTPDFETLKKARRALPSKENTQKLGIDTAVLGKDTVVVTAYAKGGFKEGADLVIETPNAILTAPPEIIPDENDKTRAMFKIKAPSGMDLSKELFGKDVTLLLINGTDAIERPFTF